MLRAIKDLLHIVTARVTNGIQTVASLLLHPFYYCFRIPDTGEPLLTFSNHILQSSILTWATIYFEEKSDPLLFQLSRAVHRNDCFRYFFIDTIFISPPKVL